MIRSFYWAIVKKLSKESQKIVLSFGYDSRVGGIKSIRKIFSLERIHFHCQTGNCAWLAAIDRIF